MKYWEFEVQRLKNERNEIQMQFENHRQKVGKYLEHILPIISATYKADDAKHEGDLVWQTISKFWKEYYEWIKELIEEVLRRREQENVREFKK